jgi:hypothetical protein
MRVILKVRKTQHQNPEFGHTQGEVFLKPAKEYISIHLIVAKRPRKGIAVDTERGDRG